MSENNKIYQYITNEEGVRLACVLQPGRSPTTVFLPGFRSDMDGTKGMFLHQWAQDRGNGLLRLDYSGHGKSEGCFEDGTIGRWADDALLVIDRFVSGPIILVGSSMGGWIMLLLARRIPERIAGMVGIAAAPDFTERLLKNELGESNLAAIASGETVYLPSDYDDEPVPITPGLMADGAHCSVLPGGIDCPRPVRLLHGVLDNDVPWRMSLETMNAVNSQDIRLTLIKNGDHRLSDDASLDLLGDTLDDLIRLSDVKAGQA